MIRSIICKILATFLVIVFGLAGCGGKSNAPDNKVTLAEAGPAQNVVVGSRVHFDGSQSSGANGNILNYQWTLISQPAGSKATLTNASTIAPYFVVDLPGQYILRLTVNDGITSGVNDTVLITATLPAANAVPVANAGPTQNVSTKSLVTLNGSGSTDSNNDQLTYRWTLNSQPSGSTAVLAGVTTVAPTFVADKAGVYAISLVVNDGKADSNTAPVAVIATDSATTLSVSSAWFYTSDSVADTWSPTLQKLTVTKIAQDWEANLSLSPIALNAGRTYSVALICSSPSSSSYTIKFQKNGDPYTIYASQIVSCDGQQKDVSMMSPYEDPNAMITLNVGAAVGSYSFGNSVIITPGIQGAVPVIPDGAIFLQQTLSRDVPPQNYSAILLWAQAATLKVTQLLSDRAQVTIDYWKLIKNMPDGTKTVVWTNNYDNFDVTSGAAGLYTRSPIWFDPATNDYHTSAYNVTASGGFLNINLSPEPNVITHWWSQRVLLTPGATYSTEVRFKVDGKTSVQFGSDWWRDLSASPTPYSSNCQLTNNCEAWMSDWFGDTGGQFITVTVPRR